MSLTTEEIDILRRHAQALCNGLKPGDDEWDTQITMRRRRAGDDDGDPWVVDLWVADVDLCTLDEDGGCDSPGAGLEMAEAIVAAGPGLYRLLAEAERLQAALEREREERKAVIDDALVADAKAARAHVAELARLLKSLLEAFPETHLGGIRYLMVDIAAALPVESE